MRETETLRRSMEDAGCCGEELDTAERLCRAGETGDLVRFLRQCRGNRLEELHERQRNLDRLDRLIRQAKAELDGEQAKGRKR